MNVENSLDVKNLCSRKLWEIFSQSKPSAIDVVDLTKITHELLVRRHNLQKNRSSHATISAVTGNAPSLTFPSDRKRIVAL